MNLSKKENLFYFKKNKLEKIKMLNFKNLFTKKENKKTIHNVALSVALLSSLFINFDAMKNDKDIDLAKLDYDLTVDAYRPVSLNTNESIVPKVNSEFTDYQKRVEKKLLDRKLKEAEAKKRSVFSVTYEETLEEKKENALNIKEDSTSKLKVKPSIKLKQ
jgi:hypothetical protein